MSFFDTPDLTGSEVTGAVIYGPPRSRRGRLTNLIRRFFRRDEQDEIYAYLKGSALRMTGDATASDVEYVRLEWDKRGVLQPAADPAANSPGRPKHDATHD